MKFYLDLKDKRLQEVERLIRQHYEHSGKKVDTLDLFDNLQNIKNEDVCILSPAYKWTKEFFCMLPQGVTIFGGNLMPELSEMSKKYNYHNMMQKERFVVDNARLTAEGFLAKFISETGKSIYEQKILVIGSGRVAKAVWAIFSKLGVKFDCTMRRESEIALSRILCNKSFPLNTLDSNLTYYDVVINTAPAVLFNNDDSFASEAVLFELSSVKSIEGECDKIRYVPCPALPAKYLPISAGRLIYNLVADNLNL